VGRPIVECVPNFSVGNDPDKLRAIAEAISSAPGVLLLDETMDSDHNRSVITFAGPPDAVAEGAFRGVRAAVGIIDLRKHVGVHPRIGAADVVPFVPVENATLEECARIAHDTGRRVWLELGVPVYFYEAAALAPERRRLERIRRGDLAPDMGGPALHPTAGATVVGARKFLIAFNVNLATTDVEIARRIARKVRESSGGLPCIKALGLPLASRGLAQVSMNLTDFEVTPLDVVFEAVRKEAAREGVEIRETEIVGLAPRRALEHMPVKFPARVVLEERLTPVE
jgi:glutamate formiminotransferase/glutamate formiminotransferase/formiminotetrahydrofolate cyclodeaminase